MQGDKDVGRMYTRELAEQGGDEEWAIPLFKTITTWATKNQLKV
jgi:hypothetical protein